MDRLLGKSADGKRMDPPEASVMSAFEYSAQPVQRSAPSSLPSVSPPSPLLAEWKADRDAKQVPDARHHVRRLAERFGYDFARDVELLASELLGNAVLHGHGPTITISVLRTAGVLRVQVHDDGSAEPDFTPDQDPLAERGRGLLILDALATSWGLDHNHQTGTTAWFEVAL